MIILLKLCILYFSANFIWNFLDNFMLQESVVGVNRRIKMDLNACFCSRNAFFMIFDVLAVSFWYCNSVIGRLQPLITTCGTEKLAFEIKLLLIKVAY